MQRTLQDIVATVESNNRPGAIRFEPDVYASPWQAFGADWPATVQFIAQAHDCSALTARMIASSSWGAYQVMGFNLWGPAVLCGLTVPLFLTMPGTQSATFRRFARTGAFDPDNFDTADDALLLRFARFWNGPGNVQGYHDRLVAARDAP